MLRSRARRQEVTGAGARGGRAAAGARVEIMAGASRQAIRCLPRVGAQDSSRGWARPVGLAGRRQENF